MMVVELYADRLGLADKHLLVGAVILQECAGQPLLAGRALAFPVSQSGACSRPKHPTSAPAQSSFQNLCMRLGSLTAHEALHGFLEYGLDVVAVIGRGYSS